MFSACIDRDTGTVPYHQRSPVFQDVSPEHCGGGHVTLGGYGQAGDSGGGAGEAPRRGDSWIVSKSTVL